MALEITGTIELDNGLSLSSIYGRTRYNVNDSSNKILIVVDYWIDEASYTSRKLGIIPSFNVDKQYAYNRAVDGVDVLDFTNQTIKAELEALGYSVVITEL
jgi:hypothetical protein